MQYLYAAEISDFEDTKQHYKNLSNSIHSIHDLYLLEISLLIEIFKKAVNKYEARPFKIAKGIKMMVIDADTGKKADFGSKQTIIESYKKEKIENQIYSSNCLLYTSDAADE